MWKKQFLWIMLLGSLVLLTACGQSKESQVSMGRYIEQDMPIEDQMRAYESFAFQYSDGSIQLINLGEGSNMQDEIQSYRQLKGERSFKSEDVPWVEAYEKVLEDKEATPWAIDVDEENQLYAACTITTGDEDDPSNMHTYVFKFGENGVTENMLNIGGQFPFIQPQKMQILDSGHCIFQDMNEGIQEFDLETGDLVRSYGSSSGNGSLMVKEDKLYVINYDNKEMEIYSLTTGQLEEAVDCDKIDDDTCIFQGDEGIYLATKEGIWHRAEQGDIWEQLMEGAGVSLGLPSHEIKAAFYQDGAFIVCLDDDQNQVSFKVYTYSDTTPTKPEMELTAYMLEDNKTIREMLVAYEIAHPEVRIRVQQGIGQEGGLTKDDAIKGLHTELLAGGGPDLLVMDGLDMETYSDKGLLACLDEIEGMDTLVPQIAEGMKQEGETYCVPLRFSVPCFLGENSVLDEVESINDLMAYQKDHMDTPMVSNLQPEVLYANMAKLDEKEWLTSDNALNKEKVGSFLEGIKNLTSFYSEPDPRFPEGVEVNEFMLQRQGVIDLACDKIKVQILEASSFQDVCKMSGLTDTREHTSIKAISQEGKICFEPLDKISINKNSKRIESAKEILSFMLQEANQEADIAGGFPVQKEALEKCLAHEEKTDYGIMGYEAEGQTITIDGNSRSQVEAFKGLLDQLEQPIMEGGTIEGIVLEEATTYFNGEESLEEVLAALEAKVALYKEG